MTSHIASEALMCGGVPARRQRAGKARLPGPRSSRGPLRVRLRRQAQIVGFNLPCNLSRLAIRHASARRSTRGGFSLTMSEDWPPVALKHLSQRSALIRFTGDGPAKELNADEGQAEEFDDDTEEEADDQAGPDHCSETPACACLRNELKLRQISRVVASHRSGGAGVGDDEGRVDRGAVTTSAYVVIRQKRAATLPAPPSGGRRRDRERSSRSRRPSP